MAESTRSLPPRDQQESRTWSSKLRALLLDQQERWERGESPVLESYVERHSFLRRNVDDALTLLYHEVLLRERRGETPEAAEYVRRFPTWAKVIREHFEIHAAL